MPDTTAVKNPNRYHIDSSVKGPILMGIILVIFITLPIYTSAGNLRLIVEILAMITMAQAWNLLAGYTGFVSVGQQAFIGIGAYALFFIAINTGLNPFLVVPLAGLVAALIGTIAAPALFHLRGPYFAIGTWVLAEMFRIYAMNTGWLGGGNGLTLSRVMKEIPREWRTSGTYWIALGLAALSILLIFFLLRSRFGLAIRTVRDNEASAESVGVNVWAVKFGVFIVASFLTGCAGAIFYLNALFISPNATFSVEWSALIIFIVIIGGIGTIEGPIIGALIYFILREWLADFGTWYIISLGSIAIIVMIYAPNGIWGLIVNKYKIHLFSTGAKVIGYRS